MIRNNILIFILVSILNSPSLFAQQTKGFDYYYQSGIHLLSLRDSSKHAIAMFDSAIKINPKEAEAYKERGNAKINCGLPVEGIKDFDSAILMADKKEKIKYLEFKEEKLTDGKFIPVMNRLVNNNNGDLFPNGEKKLNGFNIIHPSVSVKKYFTKEQIKDVFDEAIKLFPDTDIVYIDRSNYFHKNKDFASAIKDIKKAIHLKSNPKNYMLLACTMYNSGEYSDRKIENILNQCIKKNPTDWYSYNYRAMLFSFRNLPQKAIKDYDKAIEIYPNAASYYNRAEAKKLLKQKYSDQDIQADYSNAMLYKDK